jgi:hypothetical protein
MAGHGEKRARKWEQAIAALLSEPTLERAALATGVSVRCLKNWLASPAFAAAYRDARRRTMETTIGRLQGAAALAVDALLECLQAPSAAARVTAAKVILDKAVAGVELGDILQRLEILERVQGEKNGKPSLWR